MEELTSIELEETEEVVAADWLKCSFYYFRHANQRHRAAPFRGAGSAHAGQTDTVANLESGAGQAPLPRATAAELFKRGLLMLDGVGCGTSSSKVEDVQIISPKSAQNQYPVAGSTART
jgi:hypothetical protein